MEIRVITQSNENGNEEYVEFTDDFETDVSEFLYPNCSCVIDKVIEMDEVISFPLNYTLKRL